ncbi:MAG TPA: hypothetical protein VFR76_01630 [Verrucomicrobiae bacterium]|nr:hypothetical protein [Verrucomicrobiae bacterium]
MDYTTGHRALRSFSRAAAALKEAERLARLISIGEVTAVLTC